MAKSKILDAAFKEVFTKEPKAVAKTRAKKGAEAARKQKIAIAFSKSRSAGGPG
jgi:hypothetical protein